MEILVCKFVAPEDLSSLSENENTITVNGEFAEILFIEDTFEDAMELVKEKDLFILAKSNVFAEKKSNPAKLNHYLTAKSSLDTISFEVKKQFVQKHAEMFLTSDKIEYELGLNVGDLQLNHLSDYYYDAMQDINLNKLQQMPVEDAIKFKEDFETSIKESLKNKKELKSTCQMFVESFNR